MLRCRALRQPGARICRARFASSHAWDVLRTEKCYTLLHTESGFIAQFPHQKHWAIFQWAGGRYLMCMGFDGSLQCLSDAPNAPGFVVGMTVRRGRDTWEHGDRDGGDGRHGIVTVLHFSGYVDVKWAQTEDSWSVPASQLVPVHYPDGSAFDPELILDFPSLVAVEKHPGSHPFSALNGDVSPPGNSDWILLRSSEHVTMVHLGPLLLRVFEFQEDAVVVYNSGHAGRRIPYSTWPSFIGAVVELAAEENHSGLARFPWALDLVKRRIPISEANAEFVNSEAECQHLQAKLDEQRALNAEVIRKLLMFRESRGRDASSAARKSVLLGVSDGQNQDADDHDEPQEDGLSAEVDHQQLQESLLELKEQLQEQCNAEQELRAVAERSEAAANAQISALTDQVQKLGAKVAESDKLIARHTAELSAAAAREQKLNSDLTAAKTAAAAREQKLSAELDQTKKDCSQRAVEAKSAAAREQKLSAELAEKEKDCAKRAAKRAGRARAALAGAAGGSSAVSPG
eukprot:TRINITY_DN122_c0_g2_i7.p1 TRINITY_DN122_c0_g2~~TRINITY_DN122_c0_g2_i7.p1  ORF type:complete len:516 (+),score=97.84 TRINITY_DN122_c0_g2_i7:86-1633(+)